ncbi:uncharacterized protein LOC119309448 [Triticum dicoccoides]|uniref:uncharacterized protein LOC119309448 n=1 Tax=Triticum dicoccoides TaxID=85692 RepID=UPI001890E867|nr:uncharacterized protein LOC119309448 [Triticum dicoccoides]
MLLYPTHDWGAVDGLLFSSISSISSSPASHSVHARFTHSLHALFVASLRFVRTPYPPALHHGHPFLHWCCWLSFLGFCVGSFVGVWLVLSLLSRLFHLADLVQNLRLAHRRVFILLVGSRQGCVRFFGLLFLFWRLWWPSALCHPFCTCVRLQKMALSLLGGA